jgi:tripartite-type tricarboxylate transporter receptor subunit TctC
MRKIVLAVVAALAFGGAARAENYPSHPITIIVPFAAGGPSDAMARILAERMKITLGEVLLVENVTGAGGSIGVGRAVRSAPDGYTISFGHLGTHVANGAIYKLGYDLVTDLEPVALLPSNPMIIVSRNAVPAKSLKEFLAWLKAQPKPPTAGTAGAGSGSHIAGLYFENVTGIKLQYVPYRGTAPAMNDLVAGQIDLIVDQTSNRAGTRRQHPRLCRHRRQARLVRCRHSDRGRSGTAGISHDAVVRPLGTQGHAQGDRRETECRCCRGPQRSGGEQAA